MSADGEGEEMIGERWVAGQDWPVQIRADDGRGGYSIDEVFVGQAISDTAFDVAEGGVFGSESGAAEVVFEAGEPSDVGDGATGDDLADCAAGAGRRGCVDDLGAAVGVSGSIGHGRAEELESGADGQHQAAVSE